MIYVVFAFIIVLMLWVRFMASTKVGVYFFTSIILLVILMTIPMLYTPIAWSANSFTPISFIFTVSFFLLSRKVCVSLSTLKYCYIAFLFQSIISLLCVFAPGSFDSEGALVLNMGNPNQTAMLLWSFFCFCFLFWVRKKFNNNQSVALWILLFGLMVEIYLTRSRTVLLSCAIVIIGYLWIRKSKSHGMFSLAVQRCLLIAPIIIPFLIINLVKVLPYEISILGKSLFSGREIIWNNVIETFLETPFSHHLIEAPYYSNIMQSNVEMQKAWGCHNGILAIQWNYGLIVTALVIFLFCVQLKHLRKIADKNENSSMAYLVVLASIFSLSFEEGLILGNICTTILLPMLFIIGRSEEYHARNCEMYK